VIAKGFYMTNQLINNQEALLSEQERSKPSVISLSSATLRYHSAGEDHYFAINRLSVCTIGRNSANNISLDDHLLSRDHAAICCSADDVCELTDAGSSNGTRVNGSLINGAIVLKDGDVIQAGQHIISFIKSDQSVDLVTEANADNVTAIYAPNSLITALSINIRGYAPLLQILGEERLAELMADIAAIAGEVFTRRKAWSHRHEGSAIHAVWAHYEDWLSARDLLNVFDAIAEIQLGLRPLQKRYHLLRPISFGCGVTTGNVLLENIGEAVATDFDALCTVVQRAYLLEIATRATGCDMLIAESGLSLLSPSLAADRLPVSCFVSTKDTAQMTKAYALQFDQLGALSGAIAGLASQTARCGRN
jgi:adenylate cyclase